MNSKQLIVPGLYVCPSGHATVDPSLHDVLFDLALALEGPTRLPVDMQHVVAAIVLASRDGELNEHTQLAAQDEALVNLLAPHIKAVFTLHGGVVGDED